MPHISLFSIDVLGRIYTGCRSGQIDFQEFLQMVRSKQGADGQAGGSDPSFVDKLRESARLQIGNMVTAEEMSWMYGKFCQVLICS